MAKNKNSKHQMTRTLQQLYRKGCGVSKREVRAEFRAEGNRNAASPYIHGRSTLEGYITHAGKYGDWLREQGHNKTTEAERVQLAPDYLREMADKGWSASSLKLARAAIAKANHSSSQQIGPLPVRSGGQISRGRASHGAEPTGPRQAERAAVGRAAGLRSSEWGMDRLKDVGLDQAGNVVSVTAVRKGGQVLTTPVREGSRGQQLLTAAYKAGGLEGINDLMRGREHDNTHGYRADYAAWAYQHAAELGLTGGKGSYHSNVTGLDYDRQQIDYANHCLGHGDDRAYTAVVNYLSYGQDCGPDR